MSLRHGDAFRFFQVIYRSNCNFLEETELKTAFMSSLTGKEKEYFESTLMLSVKAGDKISATSRPFGEYNFISKIMPISTLLKREEAKLRLFEKKGVLKNKDIMAFYPGKTLRELGVSLADVDTLCEHGYIRLAEVVQRGLSQDMSELKSQRKKGNVHRGSLAMKLAHG